MNRRRIGRLAMLVIGFLMAMNSFGQERKLLTLPEAIDLSIKNSKQLKSSAAKIEEAVAAVKEAEERKLPEVGASASYLRLNNPNIDLKTKSNNSGGGSGTTTDSPKPSQMMYGMVNASVPIFFRFQN